MNKKCIGTNKWPGCNDTKSIEEFYTKGTRKDGSIRRSALCIECDSLYSKAKYMANHTQRKEIERIRCQKKMTMLLLPENKILLEAKRTKDRENNRKRRAKIKQDIALNEKCLEKRRIARVKHKEQERAYSAKRNAEPHIKQRKKAIDKKRYEDNKENISLARKERRIIDEEFAEKDRARGRRYTAANPEKCRASQNNSRKKRISNDPVYKLRMNVSSQIADALHKIGSSKQGESIMQYLPYTIEELKDHLENQFEPWMTWENHGRYNPKTWDDNDTSTWKWNMDHIMPQSDLPYTSMADENFKKCWALSNLRPYGAKPNVLEGVHRIRHRKEAA